MFPERTERVRAALTTTLVCLAVLSPMVPWDNGKLHDDFPLTWYPMFRGVRPAKETITWVRAELRDGTTHPVPVGFWTPGGMTEGRAHLDRAVKTGQTQKFCGALAEKFAARTSSWPSRAVELALVRTTWSLATYYGDAEPQPISERVLDRCPVIR